MLKMHGGHQMFFGLNKSKNPKERFCAIILGVEMFGIHQMFLRKDIGRTNAWQLLGDST
jgi:hypothetical protein